MSRSATALRAAPPIRPIMLDHTYVLKALLDGIRHNLRDDLIGDTGTQLKLKNGTTLTFRLPGKIIDLFAWLEVTGKNHVARVYFRLPGSVYVNINGHEVLGEGGDSPKVVDVADLAKAWRKADNPPIRALVLKMLGVADA